MRRITKLFYTTIILTITNFLMRTVGVWFHVYLVSIIGSVGIGIFQLILSVYALAKTLAYGGMNLAATRLCIDDFEHTRSGMRRVLGTAATIGTGAAVLLFSLSDFLSEVWILSTTASSALKILAVSLPFVSLSSGLNGYMTAVRKMSQYSFIQFTEQIVKISATVLFFQDRSNMETERALFLVCLAITISEVVSFSIAILFYIFDIVRNEMKLGTAQRFWYKMARLALPDAFGSYIRSVLNTIEHLLIPRGIRSSGSSVDVALSEYGTVQGMALPVLLYPSAILGVISGLLVPEIAECHIKKNKVEVNYIINRVLQISLLFSLLTMAVMFFFSDALSLVIYHTEQASYYIRLLAPLIPIMFLDMTTDGMLKGLDKQLSIMKINIIDSVLCVILVSILVPKIAVDGYIITIYVAEIINFILSFIQLGNSAKLRFRLIKNLILPLFTALLTGYFTSKALSIGGITLWKTVFAITTQGFLYVILLRLTGGITKEDSTWFRSLLFPKTKKTL